MKIAILEPAPRDNFWFHTNVRTPHLGPPILTGILKQRGHDARVFSELVKPIDYEKLSGIDVVGVSLNTTLSYEPGLEIIRRVRRLRPGVPIIAGGHHATLNVSETARHVDYVVRGFAETALPDLVDALRRGEYEPVIGNVSFISPTTGRMVHGPPAEVESIHYQPDLSAIDGYDELLQRNRWRIERYGTHVPLSFYSRGCAFSCHFCSIPLADDRRLRVRSSEALVRDLKYQIGFYKFPYLVPRIWLIDDNFGQHPTPTKELLRDLIAARLRCRFVVQARVEIARDPELLQLMRRAGFTAVYLGIESVTNESLQSFNKRSNVEKIKTAIRAVQVAGLDVVALLIFGSDEDRPGVAQHTYRFLRDLGVRHVNPQIAAPYPGTELHRRVSSEGRLFLHDFSHCNRAPVHFPLHLRPSQVLREICSLSRSFLGWPLVLSNVLRGDFQTWITRRGVLKSGYLDRVSRLIPAIEELEDGFYDDGSHLQVNKLHYARRNGELEERVARLQLVLQGTRTDANLSDN